MKKTILVFILVFLCGCSNVIEQKTYFDICELKEVKYIPQETNYVLVGNTIAIDTIDEKYQTVVLFKERLITIDNKALYDYAKDNLNIKLECIVLYIKDSNNIESLKIKGIKINNELIEIS